MMTGFRRLSLLLGIALTSGLLAAQEFSGYAETELRLFPQSSSSSDQSDALHLSFAIEPEWFYAWEESEIELTVSPFIRWDFEDSERTHADVRELNLFKAWDDWELKVGVSKVFWGVTESRHLVDLVNQTDLVEDLDFDEKLGQPMIQLVWIKDWGDLEFFILPGFRERTFPGLSGRLRSIPEVDTNNPIYQSGAEEWHVDYAIRWSHYWGEFDIGLSYFYGTSRDPLFQLSNVAGGVPRLSPVYNLMQQVGLDLQWTHDSWLWKLEAIARSGRGQHFQALTGGFEHTFYGIGGTVADAGVLVEYHTLSGDGPILLNNDFFIGTRIAMNDEWDTEFLGGPMIDVGSGAASVRAEFSRRLNDHWTIAVEGQAFAHVPNQDPLFSLRKDSFFRLQLRRYF